MTNVVSSSTATHVAVRDIATDEGNAAHYYCLCSDGFTWK